MKMLARRRAVQKVMATPGGLGHHNVADMAEEWGVSTRTIWQDRSWLKENWEADRDLSGPVSTEEYMAEVNAALAKADRAGKDVTGLLKLKASVLGLEAPKRVDVTVSAEERIEQLPRALVEEIGRVMRLVVEGGELSPERRYLAGLLEDRPQLEGDVVEAEFEEV